MKSLQVKLEDTQFRQLKVVAAKRDTSISELIRTLVDNLIVENK